MDQMITELLLGPLLNRIEALASEAHVPAKPTERQMMLMCGLWGAFDLVRQGEHPIIACLTKSGEIC